MSFMKITRLFIIMVFVTSQIFAEPGKVYLVLGSDTAIWDGMDVAKFNCTYNLSLYTDPTRNATGVMNPAWRLRFRDSYGTPLKLTWWMMAGNIFRYATNRNVPIPNIMTLYLMQKNYGSYIKEIGDELSLHYHTFVWTDYDQDGRWYWNQARDFNESRTDFDFTLCQFLLEENVFPVSFRSGWHYMDNHWQNYLNELLPFSMHNDWPNKRTSDPEPIDNIYDWSKSPSAFVPWHPSPDDYRIPGDGSGWNVRSTHFSTARYRELLDTIFVKASQGVDQVACLWGHLPETDFLTNIEALDSVAHRMETKYPGVKFRYCSAIEAMQRWLGTTDSIPPALTFTEISNDKDVYFRIITDEPIFQKYPFVAIKDVYENYQKIPCHSIGENQWETNQPVSRTLLAKAGVAVSDIVGNQSKAFINYLPDDFFIDNADAAYQELRGNWHTVNSYNYWGNSIRIATLATTDSVVASWQIRVPQTGLYNIFVQIPKIDNPATTLTYKIETGEQILATKQFCQGLQPDDWNFIATVNLTANQNYLLKLEANGNGQANTKVAADVVKISALVRAKDLQCSLSELNFGQVSQLDTARIVLQLSNTGYQPLTISAITCGSDAVKLNVTFPQEIAPMGTIAVVVNLIADEMGFVNDTLTIFSDDPLEPVLKLPLHATITTHFVIIDNDDVGHYFESGVWHYSVAQAYGPTSRYAALNQNPPAYARFLTTIRLDGEYELFEIVPTTVNASNDALYIVSINNVPIDSVHLNQNTGSGNWVKVAGNYRLHKNDLVEIKVLDTGKNTNPGAVLRADAVKLAWVSRIGQGIEPETAGLPRSFELAQNFPNPFNAATTINYAVPTSGIVKIAVYNALGQIVVEPVHQYHSPGYYTLTFQAGNLSSGFYFYSLSCGEAKLVRKMLVLK